MNPGRPSVGLGARHFVEGRPVAAGVDGIDGGIERRAVLL